MIVKNVDTRPVSSYRHCVLPCSPLCSSQGASFALMEIPKTTLVSVLVGRPVPIPVESALEKNLKRPVHT